MLQISHSRVTPPSSAFERQCARPTTLKLTNEDGKAVLGRRDQSPLSRQDRDAARPHSPVRSAVALSANEAASAIIAGTMVKPRRSAGRRGLVRGRDRVVEEVKRLVESRNRESSAFPRT